MAGIMRVVLILEQPPSSEEHLSMWLRQKKGFFLLVCFGFFLILLHYAYLHTVISTHNIFIVL